MKVRTSYPECHPSRARKEAVPAWSTMFFSGAVCEI
jgi:hypothetical protein